jgi:5-methylcytosine-specific restriction endonuclease McrA
MSDIKRKRPSYNFETRLLVEANSLCPLCGKYLHEEKNNKTLKLYEIAHIYPHSPTPEQLIALKDITKPKEVEAFENMIALCKDCHSKQDFHTTTEEYIRLYDYTI